MSSKQDPRAQLAALKKLKAKYGLNSTEAFRYLRSQEWLRNLHSALTTQIDRSSQSTIQALSLAKLEWLVVTISEVIASYLEKIAAEESTTEDWIVATVHGVATPVLSPAEYGEQYPERSNMYNWIISNYADLIQDYIQWCASSPGEFTNVGQNSKFFLGTITWLNQLALRESAGSSSSNLIEVRSVGSTQTTSLFAFSDAVRAKSWLGKEDNQTIIDQISVMPNEYDLTPSDRQLLAKAIADLDMQQAHSIVQKAIVKGAKRKLAQTVASRKDSLLKGERLTDDWLCGVVDHSIYERAEREYTLGYFEVERRIALSEVREFWNQKTVHDQEIDEVIALKRKKLKFRQARLKESEKRDPSSFIIPKEKAAIERMRYEMLALIQNKKWLIETLSQK